MSSEPIYGIPGDWQPHYDAMIAQDATPWTRRGEIYSRLQAEGITGKEVTFINLDTGWTKHVDLPEPIAARNFTGGAASDVTDRHGHGNHCIGSNCGRNGLSACPDAKVKVGKVLGDSGSGGNTVAGLRWAASESGDIVSCSWGGGSSVDESTSAALRAIEASGKWIFFAAGNSGYNGRNTVISPALSRHCICVASVDSQGNPSGFSSGGPRVDIAAGGSQIVSAGLRNNRVLMSGTSMSTPTAASDAGLLRQVFKMLGMDVYLDSRGLVKFLKSEEFLKDAGPVGRDPRFGEGIVVTSENILNWIAKKLGGIVAVFVALLCSVASAQIQWADPPLINTVEQKQVVFLDAEQAEVQSVDGGVQILVEGLKGDRNFGVLIRDTSGSAWAEVHPSARPFPPLIVQPFRPGVFLVRGQPGEKFFVSLRGGTIPAWIEVTITPSNKPEPIPTPTPEQPDAPDTADLTRLSRELSANLNHPEDAAAIKAAIMQTSDDLLAQCEKQQCPTLKAAQSAIVASINNALLYSPNTRTDWFGGWRQPISEAINQRNPIDSKTYLALIRAAAAGL